MAADTKIEWAHDTFNPWVGCTAVSPACAGCYAEAWAKRAGRPELWQGRRDRTTPANWRQPLKWNREAAALGHPRRVFCASLADVFDNQVDPAWREDLWALIHDTPHLTWMLLTKRPQNIAKMLPAAGGLLEPAWPWPNVWLGTTVENQAEADRRIPHLLAVPAAKRFLSCEPLLGPVDLKPWFRNDHPGGYYLTGNGLDWVIAGFESGPGARPGHPDHARRLRDQCAACGVPFLFKQWGEFAPEGVNKERWLVRPDGSFDPDPLPEGLGRHAKDGFWVSYRVGKKAAGRLLDGVLHDGMPA